MLGQAVGAAGMGMVVAAVTLYCQSIWPAVFIHFAADFVGLGALGGYINAIQSPELAPSLIVSGIITMSWGAFWIWRLQKKRSKE